MDNYKISTMGSHHYFPWWNNHVDQLSSGLHSLLKNDTMVDCSIVCEDATVRAHKAVLSACSPCFDQILKHNHLKNPVIVLKDVYGWQLECILDFMYKGHTSIPDQKLESLMKAAEGLMINGLRAEDKSSKGQTPGSQKVTESFESDQYPITLTSQGQKSGSRRKQARPIRLSGSSTKSNSLDLGIADSPQSKGSSVYDDTLEHISKDNKAQVSISSEQDRIGFSDHPTSIPIRQGESLDGQIPVMQHSAPRGGPPRSWTNDNLTKALKSIWNEELSTSQAARAFGIPYNSLLMYVRGKYGKSLQLDQLKETTMQGSSRSPKSLPLFQDENNPPNKKRKVASQKKTPKRNPSTPPTNILGQLGNSFMTPQPGFGFHNVLQQIYFQNTREDHQERLKKFQAQIGEEQTKLLLSFLESSSGSMPQVADQTDHGKPWFPDPEVLCIQEMETPRSGSSSPDLVINEESGATSDVDVVD